MQGFVLGGFALGNVCTVFMGGILSEKFGGKIMFTAGILLSGIFGLFIPIAAKTSPVFVIILRALQGACQGPLIPAYHNMAAEWFPKHVKNLLMSLTVNGKINICLLYTSPSPRDS